MRIGIALGSNLGDRMENLRAARDAIISLAATKNSVLASSVYETEPIGCEPGAAKFLNAVLEIEYAGDPHELLERTMQIEQSLGRDRDHAASTSRKIDIDLLYADDIMTDNARLQLPHPRMCKREFVLRPLAEIGPDLVLPNQSRPVRELLAQVADSTKVQCFARKW